MEVNRMGRLFANFLSWLREGIPSGVPPTDHVPLIALLTRPLTDGDGIMATAGQVAE
jgi:hypothetical protein